ncbi:hypothetical protein PV04_07572 [Phialophora macrospora]|uniref:Uncharacterized protein n=1 Tax=Phialophora macrospora TaxID=1851006 RepID=A0A0D2CJ82_9EURO|nr:hypothetical protein PV04_07572 [Phialophora macrospora]
MPRDVSSPVALQVAKLDTDLNSYAINCNNNREYTNDCGSKGFSCNSNGVIAISHPMRDYFCEASCWCQNLFSPPKPIPCIAKNVRNCLVDNGIATDAETGKVVGNVSRAKTLTNGTLDLTARIEKRDPELSHDFAIVCRNRVITGLCQDFDHRYSCDANGRVIHKGVAEKTCEKLCECINILPAPRLTIPCYAVNPLPNIQKCKIIDDSIYDANGTVVGNLTDATFLPNGTLQYTAAAPVEKRNKARLLVSSTVTSLPILAATPTSRQSGGLSTLAEVVARDANRAAKVSIPVVTKVSAVPTTTPSNTLDFSTPTQLPQEDAALSSRSEPELNSQSLAADSRFDLQCITHGKYNQSLTDRCMSEKYTCLRISTYPLAMLHHTGTPDPECSAKCQCPDSFSKDDIAPAKVVNMVPAAVNLDGSLACFTNGKANETLTSYCSDNGYACLDLAGGTFLDTMYHTGSSFKDCDKKCQCPQPLRRRSLLDKPSAHMNVVLSANAVGASPTDSLQPVQFECWSKDKYNDTLTQHCWDHDYGCQELVPGTWLYTLKHWGDEIPACTHGCRCPNLTRRKATPSIHPKPFLPARSGPVQASNQYKLSCGNRPDGPKFCSSADLGYFCTANMTVARNTTVHNNDSNWCDASCNCIFAGTVPCINDWGIPRCRELLDGTVRDADDMQIVLAYTGNVAVLANGTLLIEKAQGGFFPFVATESGFLHDGNGTSVLFNASAN